jgi:hypothetical protein
LNSGGQPARQRFAIGFGSRGISAIHPSFQLAPHRHYNWGNSLFLGLETNSCLSLWRSLYRRGRPHQA